MSEGCPLKGTSEEQYPLLKMVVDAGGAAGDTVYRFSTPRGWLRRYTERVPACWLTILLIMVSVMGVFALSATVSRRQALLLKLFNDRLHRQREHRIGEPPADLFYYKILQDRAVSFSRYSLYLSDMAVKYPSLNLHVTFLVDNSQNLLRRYDSRHVRKAFKIRPDPFSRNIESKTFQQEVVDFTAAYPNVNVTAVPLDQHMTTTPMNYRWRTLPKSILQFYCGAHAVWKQGGIALDLDTFNDDFKLQRKPDERIIMILGRYNDGLRVKRGDIDDKIDVRHEEDSLFSANFHSMWSLLRDRLFHNVTEIVTVVDIPAPENHDVPHIRKRRCKREAVIEPAPEILNNSDSLNSSSWGTVGEPQPTTTNDTKVQSAATDATPSDVDIALPKTSPLANSKKPNLPLLKKPINDVASIQNPILLVDFTFDIDDDMWSDSFWPFNYPFKPTPRVGSPGSPIFFGPTKPFKQAEPTSVNQLLVLEAEGKFIYSRVRYHPFLGRVLFPIGYQSAVRSVFESVLAYNCYGSSEAGFCSDLYFL